MRRKRDVLHWTPDDLGQALRNLHVFTVDSEVGKARPRDIPYMANSLVNCAIVQDDGSFMSFHVTDNPFPIEHILHYGRDLGELESGSTCKGLIVTTATQIWEKFSPRRWTFLKDLPQEAKDALVSHLRGMLAEEVQTGYISSGEHDNAVRELMHWQNGLSEYGPRMVGGQPYNIDVPQVAEKIKITQVIPPEVVPVDFVGRYLDLTTREAQEDAAYLASVVSGKGTGAVSQEDICSALRENGYDGAFTRSDISSYAEMVLWNGAKINRFGGWNRKPSMSGAGGYRQLMYFVYERPDGKRLEFRIWPRKGEMRDETGRRGLKMYHHLTDDQINLCKLVSARNIE